MMTAMNRGRRVRGIGRLVVALAVLVVPAVSAADVGGPTVRLTQPVAGRVVMEVADHTVAVRKDMAADRSVVTLTTAGDRLTVTVHRGALSVSGPGGTIAMDGTDVSYERLINVLQGSEAARRARVLLAQVTEGPDTFVGQSVLVTRLILEAGSGNTAALRQHQQWAADRTAAAQARSQGRPQLIRATFAAGTQARSPGDCWNIYESEALRIMDDFEDCTEDLRWYEGHRYAGCYVIYAVRAEAAMAWFIGCNGGIPFSG